MAAATTEATTGAKKMEAINAKIDESGSGSVVSFQLETLWGGGGDGNGGGVTREIWRYIVYHVGRFSVSGVVRLIDSHLVYFTFAPPSIVPFHILGVVIDALIWRYTYLRSSLSSQCVEDPGKCGEGGCLGHLRKMKVTIDGLTTTTTFPPIHRRHPSICTLIRKLLLFTATTTKPAAVACCSSPRRRAIRVAGAGSGSGGSGGGGGRASNDRHYALPITSSFFQENVDSVLLERYGQLPVYV